MCIHCESGDGFQCVQDFGAVAVDLWVLVVSRQDWEGGMFTGLSRRLGLVSWNDRRAQNSETNEKV